MGKKSKRKAAKAAAAAAGTSISSNGQQLILGPRPDGIVCTNEDPNLCALCSTVLTVFPSKAPSAAKFCCGTRLCDDCDQGYVYQCSFCKYRKGTPKQTVALTKERAKAGFPWSCNILGELYASGVAHVNQSYWEAFRWHEEAASKDHPISCFRIASFYAYGIDSCKKDLEKACIMFEKAMLLRAEDFFVATVILDVGVDLAEFLLKAGKTEEGLSLLVPLGKRGNGEAQCCLSELHQRVGDFEGARCWAAMCSENPDNPFTALQTSLYLRAHCVVRHWYSVASKNDLEIRRNYKAPLLKDAREILCHLRRQCAWCEISLDRSTRKMCKDCKTHCYCSEVCQSAHWNAEKNGHRSDCQKVTEVKKKVAAMKN